MTGIEARGSAAGHAVSARRASRVLRLLPPLLLAKICVWSRAQPHLPPPAVPAG